MSRVSVSSHTRRLLGGLAVVGAVIAGSVAVASVTSPGAVLALPGASESTVVTVEPTRVLDTRIDVGLDDPFTAGVSRKLTVTGSIDTYFEPTKTTTNKVVVPQGATAVLLNVTGVAPIAAGWIAVRPGDATGLPSTSNLNMVPGQVVPNAVTVAVPTSGSNAGQIDITYGPPSNATVDIIVDIVGYTTNTGLIDLVNRVEALENSGVGAESPARVVWVADDDTGDHTSLSAALAAITDAGSAKPYVIKIAPGIYTETATVVLKDFVDVEGSGQGITTITCACASTGGAGDGSVVAAGRITTEIRHLTVDNAGGTGRFAVGIYTNGSFEPGSVSILHVTATSTGTGPDYNYGVYNDYVSSPSLNHVTATATGGTTSNVGVRNFLSPVSIRNSVVTGTTFSILSDLDGKAKVADTELGGAVSGADFACVGVYSSAFVALTTSCA